MRKWLERNTVLFGDPSQDGPSHIYKMLDSTTSGYTLRMRVAAAFEKTFPGAGLDHNVKSYYGNKDVYKEKGTPENPSPQKQYEEFLTNPSLRNPTISFFGATGFKSWRKIFYVVKVPFVTLINSVRLLTEFPLYVAESAFRHLLVESKLKWNEVTPKSELFLAQEADNLPGTRTSRFFWRALSGPGILFGALGYYTFKAARLTVRLVTAPIESLRSGWDINPALGIASGILSIVPIVLLAIFVPPVGLPILGKVIGAGATTAILHTVRSLPSVAVPAITAGISALGIAATRAYQGLRNFITHRSLLREKAISKQTTTTPFTLKPPPKEPTTPAQTTPAFVLRVERPESSTSLPSYKDVVEEDGSFGRNSPLPKLPISVRAAQKIGLLSPIVRSENPAAEEGKTFSSIPSASNDAPIYSGL